MLMTDSYFYKSNIVTLKIYIICEALSIWTNKFYMI